MHVTHAKLNASIALASTFTYVLWPCGSFHTSHTCKPCNAKCLSHHCQCSFGNSASGADAGARPPPPALAPSNNALSFFHFSPRAGVGHRVLFVRHPLLQLLLCPLHHRSHRARPRLAAPPAPPDFPLFFCCCIPRF